MTRADEAVIAKAIADSEGMRLLSDAPALEGLGLELGGRGAIMFIFAPLTLQCPPPSQASS